MQKDKNLIRKKFLFIFYLTLFLSIILLDNIVFVIISSYTDASNSTLDKKIQKQMLDKMVSEKYIEKRVEVSFCFLVYVPFSVRKGYIG
jgi:hypothetical protein